MEDWKLWKEGGCGADKVAPWSYSVVCLSSASRATDSGWLGLSVFFHLLSAARVLCHRMRPSLLRPSCTLSYCFAMAASVNAHLADGLSD